MPQFFFHVYDGRDGLDLDGTELADRYAAGIEALQFAGELIKAKADRLLRGEPWRLEVTDAEGRIILRIDLILSTFSLGAFAP